MMQRIEHHEVIRFFRISFEPLDSRLGGNSQDQTTPTPIQFGIQA
jgi:hypothetical protein